MKITVRHYGAFRDLGAETVLILPAPANIISIRAALIKHLGAPQKLLVEDSALADDTAILTDKDTIGADCTLSILPPVCGG